MLDLTQVLDLKPHERVRHVDFTVKHGEDPSFDEMRVAVDCLAGNIDKHISEPRRVKVLRHPVEEYPHLEWYIIAVIGGPPIIAAER